MRFDSQVAATTISATGALAVFVLVYLLNPASARKTAGVGNVTDERPAGSEDVRTLLQRLDHLSGEMRALSGRVQLLERTDQWRAQRSQPSNPLATAPRIHATARLQRFHARRHWRVVLILIVMATLLAYALAFTSVISDHRGVLRIIYSLLGAFAGAMIPGTFSVATSGTRTILGAATALALFIIIYFLASV